MLNKNIICVSGTPGTGKTTLAKRISKDLNFKYISGNYIIKKYSLNEGIDKKRKCKIIDINKFIKAVLKECIIIENKKTSKNLKKNISIKKSLKNNKNIIKNKVYIIDSHLSHHLPKEKVNVCIVCKCNLKKLKERLEKRRYSIKKIRENLDSEIFDTCYVEAKEKKHKIILYEKDYKNILRRLKKLN
jgi:adenylate kinase